MRTTAKVIAFIIGFILIAGYLGSKSNNGKPAPAEPEEVQAVPTAKPTADVEHVGSGEAVALPQLNDQAPGDPYNANSTESFEPNGLVKNAYQWRGHSGILNTFGIPVTAFGRLVSVIPMPSMKFERMLDAETALYEVKGYENDGYTYGELAVLVNDSVAPDANRPYWRILVEGPMQGTNGFGAPITVTQVRFEGYATPEENHARVCSNEDLIPSYGQYTLDANGCRHLLRVEPPSDAQSKPAPPPLQPGEQATPEQEVKVDAAFLQKRQEAQQQPAESSQAILNKRIRESLDKPPAPPAKLTQHQADCAKMAQYHDSSTVAACSDVNGGQQ